MDGTAGKIVLLVRIGFSESNPGRSPSAGNRVARRVSSYIAISAKLRVHSFTQRARALSVNNSHAMNAPFLTLGKIVVEQSRHLTGPECMQIEFTRNGDGDGLVVFFGWHTLKDRKVAPPRRLESIG